MFVAFDLETSLIRPGILAPRIVVGSAFWEGDAEGDLIPSQDIFVWVNNALNTPDVIICGANIAFDFGCVAAAWPELVPDIFKAYEDGRIWDVQIAQALHAIAEGNLYRDPMTGRDTHYSLDWLVQHHLGRADAKRNDFWRKRYALLADKPIAEWPEEARQYPLDDAENTLAVAKSQRDKPLRNLQDLPAQCMAAWCLHLGAIWGLRTDGGSVEKLAADTEARYAESIDRYKAAGFIRPDGTENQAAVKRAVVLAYGADELATCGTCGGHASIATVTAKGSASKVRKPCKECQATGLDISDAPKTDKGGVSKDRDTLSESGDDLLEHYAESSAIDKLRETYIPMLRGATSHAFTLSPNVLVESGRTSYRGLIQTMPRSGGVRDTFHARKGFVYCSVDYASLELCTLAQACLWIVGYSRMAEAINAGMDLHCKMGAELYGTNYEDFMARKKELSDYRQAAKAANFGFPGGMGAAALVRVKRKGNEGSTTAPDGKVYTGIRFCVLLGGKDRCGEEKITKWKDKDIPPLCKACVLIAENQLRPAWFKAYPEMKKYFDHVSREVETNGEIEQLVTGRIRGGVNFTSAANTLFQGLGADGAKRALAKVSRACYVDKASPLYGSRPIFLMHDEIFAELREDRAHEAAHEMSRLMIEGMREFTPDIRIAAEPALMRVWAKNAIPVYDANGRLVPWEEKP